MIDNKIELELPNLEDRIITICGNINQDMLKELQDKIAKIDVNDKEIIRTNDEKLRTIGLSFDGYKLPPININLTTYGGDVCAGYGFYDLLKAHDVNIVANGMICSMGVPILLAGKKRSCYANTLFMVHEAWTGMVGKLEELREEVKNNEIICNPLIDIILQNTKITRSQIDDIIEHKRDWWFDAKEALNLGIVDEIIGK